MAEIIELSFAALLAADSEAILPADDAGVIKTLASYGAKILQKQGDAARPSSPEPTRRPDVAPRALRGLGSSLGEALPRTTRGDGGRAQPGPRRGRGDAYPRRSAPAAPGLHPSGRHPAEAEAS